MNISLVSERNLNNWENITMNKFVFRIRENRAVFDIKKTMPVIACLLLFASCSTTSKLPNILGYTNQTSIFANFDQLGMDKDSFLKKFGTPTSKEIYVDEQNNLIEVLYYTELLNYDMIAVTTKFRFKNGILIDQKKEEIANYVDKKSCRIYIYQDDVQF